MMKIDKKIPMPENIGVSGKPRYPWAEMKVGDSFFTTNAKEISLVQSCSRQSKLMNPKKFACRAEKDGVRVWRIK
jgi:hypothetical protein